MIWRGLNRVDAKSERFEQNEPFWTKLIKLNKSDTFWTKVNRSARRDSCHNSWYFCHPVRACDRSCHFTSSCFVHRSPSPLNMMNLSQLNGTERNEKVCVARVRVHENDEVDRVTRWKCKDPTFVSFDRFDHFFMFRWKTPLLSYVQNEKSW